jgi:hypothetical protein
MSSQREKQYGRLTVKNLQTCQGNEGYAYSCTLYLDGKKVGTARDDGNGGMVFVEFWKKVGGQVKRDVEAEKKVLAYVEEQPDVDMGERPGKPGEKWMMKADLEWVVGQVVEDAIEERQHKTWCRTKVCFRVAGQPEGEWHVFKGKFKGSEQKWRGIVETHCARKGLQLEEILNERFAA